MTRDTKAQLNPTSYFPQTFLAFCINSLIGWWIKTPKPENTGFCFHPSLSTAIFKFYFLPQWHMYSILPVYWSCFYIVHVLLDIMKVSWPVFSLAISCSFTLTLLLVRLMCLRQKSFTYPPLKSPKCPRTRLLDFQTFSKTQDSSIITCHPLQAACSSGYNPHSCVVVVVCFISTFHLYRDSNWKLSISNST